VNTILFCTIWRRNVSYLLPWGTLHWSSQPFICRALSYSRTSNYMLYCINKWSSHTSSLAPRRQRGSPFSNKQAPDLSQGK
jgi:hypothetical protein